MLAGQRVARWAFVGARAAGRKGAWPKSRRKCLRHKELEKVGGLARWSKEFRPLKKVSAKAAEARSEPLPLECGGLPPLFIAAIALRNLQMGIYRIARLTRSLRRRREYTVAVGSGLNELISSRNSESLH